METASELFAALEQRGAELDKQRTAVDARQRELIALAVALENQGKANDAAKEDLAKREHALAFRISAFAEVSKVECPACEVTRVAATVNNHLARVYTMVGLTQPAPKIEAPTDPADYETWAQALVDALNERAARWAVMVDATRAKLTVAK